MTEEQSAGRGTVAQPRPRVLHERGRLPWSLRLAVVVIYPVASLLFRLRYRHGERFPRTGPVLLVANHVSVLDPLACARLVYDHGRIPHFLAKQAVFRGLAGRILLDAGQIPVARGSSEARGSLSAAAADLEAGNVVVIYPEGSVTRDPDWWPMEARTGVARLALTTDAVVLPVAQWGPQRVHDYHDKKLHLRLRTPVDHAIGEPVDLSALRAEVRAGRALTPDLLRSTTDLIMGRVREELAALRGEPAPPPSARRPGRSLPGDPPGSAA
ncbi:1-acyl-sn-glycerol-3-phosphate acyltransferases [Geodermatophilus dictyosporus]|uniref:1-acyl-sn-glycerol-3-phosphate acyltransferases n=1 Tax=Geodermatophilus dictyosporus TaxID=1523247 RepID=A0A1I5KQS8_9ACTN|nr:lysophospholipid acyltransferase family protein [Geodermatophilus dictyosporus]SFO87459.1 1-acyl-sn-glycerol-3-phosphate acyltransferases [Geodermatophilus dictyosporus]